MKRMIASMIRLSMLAFCAVVASPLVYAKGDSDRAGALLQALREGDDARAVQWMESGANLNAQDDTGATPLMWAAQRSNLDLTRRLLAAGANPNLRNEEGLGPLQIALEVKAGDIALRLIQHGADAKAARASGETVLMTAARTGQLEVMKQLIARGAKVNAREKQFDQTALMWSAGYPEQVALLIQHGADVKARTKSWQVKEVIYTHLTHFGTPWPHDGEYMTRKGGQSALFFAVQRDDLQSVRALLDAGADVNDTAADGSTALLLSLYKWEAGGKRYSKVCDLEPKATTFSPNLPIANLLLDRGAKAAAANAAGYTPLHGAVLSVVPRARLNKCRWARIEEDEAKTLSELSADPQQALALIRRLLEAGANPNAATQLPTQGPVGYVRINPARIGSTPVHIAAIARNAALMQTLLEHDGKPNVLRIDGHSPLSLAVLVDDLPLVEQLVAHGGDVQQTFDPTDVVINEFNGSQATQSETVRRGQTLLHIAAVGGSYQVVPFLVQKGVALDRKNDKGETPLALAELQEEIRLAISKSEARLTKDNKIPNFRDPDSLVKETLTSDAIKGLTQTRTASAGM